MSLAENRPAKAPFAAYLDLMLRVDALINQGLDESPAGTALRDQMDQPWYAMTEEERDQIRAIGAALNAARDAARESVQREIANLDKRVTALESKVEYL